MKGTRPLDNSEIRLVSACFTGTFEVRNRGLFMLGVSTGGRISELLSLRVGDVYQNRTAVTDLLFDKSIVKGGEVSRAVPVNTDGMRAIDELVRWHREQYQTVNASRPLFPSRNGKGKQRMTRRAAHNVLKDAFEAAGLNGHLATHSLRKSFAQSGLLGTSLKKESDATLFLELTLRGHDLSKLRDAETTAEIIKLA